MAPSNSDSAANCSAAAFPVHRHARCYAASVNLRSTCSGGCDCENAMHEQLLKWKVIGRVK